MPRVQEGSFPSEAHGGVRIHTKAWLPDGLGADRLRDKVASPPSAVVLWSHGLHEHLGRFEKLHEALVAKNVAVYAWDHVGHGESGSCGEKRHQFPRGFDAVVADALQFARCETRQTRGTRKTKHRASHARLRFVACVSVFFFSPLLLLLLLSDLRPPRACRARHAGWCAPSTRRTPRFPFSSVA
jgi:alpha-beta hydrolase superfamily lysophospholipase